MTSKHKAPLFGWHAPAELQAWARAEAQRQEIPLSAVLTEALYNYRTYCEADPRPKPKGAPR